MGRLVFCIFFATAAVFGIDVASGGHYAPWVGVGLWLFPTIPFAGLGLQALSKLGVNAGILVWPALIVAIGFPTFWAYCLAIAKTGSWIWAALAAILGFVVAADRAGASMERSRAPTGQPSRASRVPRWSQPPPTHQPRRKHPHPRRGAHIGPQIEAPHASAADVATAPAPTGGAKGVALILCPRKAK
jgi:hypothetical protein